MNNNQSQDKHYPILNSIFNTTTLNSYQSKYRKFFLLLTLFFAIISLLICVMEHYMKPYIDGLIKYMAASHCQVYDQEFNMSILCVITDGLLFGFAVAIFVLYNFCIKLLPIVFYICHLYEFDEGKNKPNYLSNKLDAYFFQKIMQLSNFSDNDKYLFKLQLAGYISKSDIKSIQYMLDNHNSNHYDLECDQAIHIALNKLENMFKNKTFVKVGLVSEEIGKITKQYKQQDNIQHWIMYLYKQHESTLNQQKEQFSEVVSLNLNGLDVIDFHDVQLITSLDEISMFILDYIKCHGNNESVTYEYIKDVFKEHILKNNDNILKQSLDKLLNSVN